MFSEFTPIQIRDWVRLYLKSNPGNTEADVTKLVQGALQAYKAGKRCACGEPIWVIGSADVGYMCFTCITGSTDTSDDYEIAEACDKHRL